PGASMLIARPTSAHTISAPNRAPRSKAHFLVDETTANITASAASATVVAVVPTHRGSPPHGRRACSTPMSSAKSHATTPPTTTPGIVTATPAAAPLGARNTAPPTTMHERIASGIDHFSG